MSDTYQAVYDAVRSRFDPIDSGRVIAAIVSCFDFSNARAILQQEFMGVAYEHMRPSVLFRPKVAIDGNQWCALYGDNLQDGIAGFGDTVAEAMVDFDKSFTAFKANQCAATPKKEPLGAEMAGCFEQILKTITDGPND